MPMTKKYYIAIARALNQTMWDKDADPATVTAVMVRLAEVFRDDNPLFDAQRFYAACTNNPSTK